MSECPEYIDTFKRYEIKYLINENQYNAVRGAMGELFVPDIYGQSTISNIYFDTPDFRMIRASMEKPIYKEKLRLRSYKTPTADDTVFIELKKKYKSVVYKRRIDLTLAKAEDYTYRGKPLSLPSQISREIDYIMSFYPDVRPAMALFYERIAFFGADDPNLRLTFDSNIMARRTGLSLADGPGGDPIISPELRLMELKTATSIPLWLAKLFDGLKIYPASFSKYGRAYMLSMESILSEKERLNNTKETSERKFICA